VLRVWRSRPARPKLCSLDECERKHVARGFCGKHYQQAKRSHILDHPTTPKGLVANTQETA